MRIWLRDLDRLLRGDATRVSTLRAQGFSLSAIGMTAMIVVLGVMYGLCMGAFSLTHADGPVWEQLLASAVKTPLLFLLTLAVTFPSLYVFNALVGSRLTVEPLLRLLVAALGVNLAVLASLGPIVAFFSVSTTSYHFMVLLNVVVFAVAGFLGLAFLLQTLHRLSLMDHERSEDGEHELLKHDAPPQVETGVIQAEIVESVEQSTGPLDQLDGHVLGRHVKIVFRCWIVVFGLVGAQMGWVLRPFIGNPNQQFTWFRDRDSSFFESVLHSLSGLLFG